MNNPRYLIRRSTASDIDNIFLLYKSVAATLGGLARVEEEITPEYVAYFSGKALENGIQSVVVDTKADNKIVGEIHCYKPDPKVFRHVLSELTIAVDPAFQSLGLGKQLFESLLAHVQEERKDIYRIELIARESNQKAIEFYEKLGFKKEGRMEGRIKNHLEGFEADIPMAWFNPNFIEQC